jgi:small subunit ribosomal protein S18
MKQNFSIMSEYVTPMGRIRHIKETGLRPVNQRRIAKAIRRSIGIGMMPSVYRHPEILQKMLQSHGQKGMKAMHQ